MTLYSASGSLIPKLSMSWSTCSQSARLIPAESVTTDISVEADPLLGRPDQNTAVALWNQVGIAAPDDRIGDSIEYDTGDYPGLLDKTLDHVGWDDLKTEMAARRAEGESVGVGLAMFIEKSGLGPRDGVRVTVETTGAVEVVTGGSSLGQGFETVMAQICADALGVDYRRVRVVKGRTDRIEHGIGAHASRATVMTGSATHVAALAVRDKAIEVAAELLQAPAESLDVVDGEVVRIGS